MHKLREDGSIDQELPGLQVNFMTGDVFSINKGDYEQGIYDFFVQPNIWNGEEFTKFDSLYDFDIPETYLKRNGRDLHLAILLNMTDYSWLKNNVPTDQLRVEIFDKCGVTEDPGINDVGEPLTEVTYKTTCILPEEDSARGVLLGAMVILVALFL